MKPRDVVLTQLSVVRTMVIATYCGTYNVLLSYENIQASMCMCLDGCLSLSNSMSRTLCHNVLTKVTKQEMYDSSTQKDFRVTI